MRHHILALALAAFTAPSITTPAAAVIVPISYTLTLSDFGLTVPLGTMILDYDGSAYSLGSLDLTLPNKSAIVTSYVTLSPVSGSSDYCLYTFATCSVVPEKNSLYIIFDPSLTSQSSTLYVYSTDNLTTESASVTIQQAAVAEPATWALMLFGFGAIGAAIRLRRRRTVPLPA